MIVSWDWLGDYVELPDSLEAVVDRLTMTGLNLEGVDRVGGDTAVDLEVTSNRPDCLGHLGVAREIAVLYDRALRVPEADVPESADSAADATSVDVECADLCPQYHARILRGVNVGPSPPWLQERLRAVGVASVNNVVDVTNYVLLECGQPLHAFDFDGLHGGRIIVRRARPGEKITAIDQREYPLDEETCVIADADRPVAIGGVMGGFDTEIGEGTTNVLIEVADFAPLSIRSTARKLKLHSPSSYRFERGVDQRRLDWASRRCCELILQVAGGELLQGSVVAGAVPEERSDAITLRFDQIPRVLGIDVDREDAVAILEKLGCRHEGSNGDSATFVPPSWRRDLVREIDLIEEVARVHGYDRIPDDAEVPMALSSKSRRDRVAERIRSTLEAAGFHEAITLSLVSEEQARQFAPHGEKPLVQVDHGDFRKLNTLRQSLVPSLLECVRDNERHGNHGVRLFETARVYLDAQPSGKEPEVEPLVLGLVSAQPFADLKGVLEELVRVLGCTAALEARPTEAAQFASGRGAELQLNGRRLGWLGELDRTLVDGIGLRDDVTVAELEVRVLEDVAELIPTYKPLPQFPAIERDLNFVLDEATPWAELESVVRDAAGPLLERVSFSGQYRGQQIPAGMKSYVVTLDFRSSERTLTGDEVAAAAENVERACRDQLGATLRG